MTAAALESIEDESCPLEFPNVAVDRLGGQENPEGTPEPSELSDDAYCVPVGLIVTADNL